LNEWAVLINFKTPIEGTFSYTFDYTLNSAEQFTLPGIYTKHYLGVDTEIGQRANAKKASVSVSEKFFTNVGYPIRNADGEVSMKDHQVAVKDGRGIVNLYVVREWFPDEAMGLIVFILGDYGDR